eukprot:scaffold28935_cov101-Isochrysis_galbana.AAC.1
MARASHSPGDELVSCVHTEALDQPRLVHLVAQHVHVQVRRAAAGARLEHGREPLAQLLGRRGDDRLFLRARAALMGKGVAIRAASVT